jgi:hypothetical protein
MAKIVSALGDASGRTNTGIVGLSRWERLHAHIGIGTCWGIDACVAQTGRPREAILWRRGSQSVGV